MKTAVKIPEMPDDQNQQPYVTDFDFSGTNIDAYSGLYHWFGLEPVGEERTGLSFSVFIPADGTDKLYYYDHASKKQGYAGVTAMPLKVIESRKEYDWSVNKPVEFRPYIKDIAGKRRLFFLGTISAIRGDSKKFDGSATPYLALIDAEYRDVIWIDVKKPSLWDLTVYNQLSEAWRASEGIGYYYQEEKNDLDVMQKTMDSIQMIPQSGDHSKEIEFLQKKIDSLKSLQ